MLRYYAQDDGATTDKFMRSSCQHGENVKSGNGRVISFIIYDADGKIHNAQVSHTSKEHIVSCGVSFRR